MGRTAGVTAEETRRRLLDEAAAEFERRSFERTRVAGSVTASGAGPEPTPGGRPG